MAPSSSAMTSISTTSGSIPQTLRTRLPAASWRGCPSRRRRQRPTLWRKHPTSTAVDGLIRISASAPGWEWPRCQLGWALPMRQMILVGFLQAQNCTNLASSWRHPQSRTDSWSPDFYRHIGQVLEAGKFHLGFFDDRLSMPDMYGRNHAHTVAHGIRCVKLDAVTVLTVMGMATERLGLGATYSTSYYEPFHIARLFATLDLMTHGRAAWNVVTSLNDGEAQNMGRDEVTGHDLRYDRADEFMEIVLGHWDSWEDDAIVQDKSGGLFARPEKVHRLDYHGTYFRSR